MNEFNSIRQKSIEVHRTAHLFELGNQDADTFWLMAHGYAMTADQVIKKFRTLDMNNNFYVAVEALSSFYWETHDSQVPVASWMTSRFRLDEIKDYSNYLNQVYSANAHRNKKILFGFSQGGTTMWRYINTCKPDFDVFINWSGDIPKNSEYDLDYLKGKTMIYVIGDQDQYKSEEIVENLKSFEKSLDLNTQFITYEGDHRIYPEVLKRIVAQL